MTTLKYNRRRKRVLSKQKIASTPVRSLSQTGRRSGDAALWLQLPREGAGDYRHLPAGSMSGYRQGKGVGKYLQHAGDHLEPTGDAEYRPIRNNLPESHYVYQGNGVSDPVLDAAWEADRRKTKRSTPDQVSRRMDAERRKRMAHTKEVKDMLDAFDAEGCPIEQGSKNHYKIYWPKRAVFGEDAGRFLHSMSGTPRKGGMSLSRVYLRKVQERNKMATAAKPAPVKFSNPVSSHADNQLLPDLSKTGLQRSAMRLWDEIRVRAERTGSLSAKDHGADGLLWSGSRQAVMLDLWPGLSADPRDPGTRAAAQQFGHYLKLTGNMHTVTPNKPGTVPPTPAVWWVRSAWKPGPDGIDAARKLDKVVIQPAKTSPGYKYSDYHVDLIYGAIQTLAGNKMGFIFTSGEIVKATGEPASTVSSVLGSMTRDRAKQLQRIGFGKYQYRTPEVTRTFVKEPPEKPVRMRDPVTEEARKEVVETKRSKPVQRGSAAMLALRYMEANPEQIKDKHQIAEATGMAETTAVRVMNEHVENTYATRITSPGMKGAWVYIPPKNQVVPGKPVHHEPEPELAPRETPEETEILDKRHDIDADKDEVTGRVHPELEPEIARPYSIPEPPKDKQAIVLGEVFEVVGEVFEVYGVTMDKIILRDENSATFELPRSKK